MICILDELESVPDEKLGIVMICVFAVFVYCTIFIFFYDRLLGFIITLISKGVLDTNTYFKVKSIIIAPLSCRIFFKDVVFQNEDILCRIVDGYITLSVMYGQPKYKKLHEDMVSADLVQMRCQIDSTLRRDKGVIVGVDVDKRKVCVRLNVENTTGDMSEDECPFEADADVASNVKAPSCPLGNEDWEEELENIQNYEPAAVGSSSNSKYKNKIKPPVRSHPSGEQGCSTGNIKWYNYSDILLPQKYSRCRCHLDGLNVSIYNATGRYTELAAAAEELRSPLETVEKRSNFINVLKNRVKSTMRMNKGPIASEEEVARCLQKEQLHSKTIIHQFYEFVKAIEVDISAASFDIGGAKSNFPFFVHTTCKRFSGSCYRTRSGCNPIDLYRSVFDFSMENIDVRVAKIQSETVDISEKEQIDELQREKLFETLNDFSLIIDGSTKNVVHFRFYLDTPNIYAGEKITRESVPRSGLEVVLDVPRVTVSPWIEHCRGKLFEFFFPQTYLPLKPLEFKIGEPRPRAPLDVVVTFANTMTAEVLFKRKSPTIGPPFGMIDSTEVGCITSRIGSGSEYIQRGAFLLGNENNQCLKILFSGKELEVQCNAVLGLSCTLAKADSVQCYLDRIDQVIWNKCKTWNFTLSISKGMCNFNMAYISFFMDLLNDWQFANTMYLGEPLSTELYNTKNRFVKDYIPQVRKIELIIDNGMDVFLNNNHQNVIYSKDPFSRKENVLAHLRITSASFEMELPADQYLLSSRNEISRPFRGVAKNACAFLLLPPSHPYHDSLKETLPFASVKSFEVVAVFTSQVGNQTIPQSVRTPSPFHQHLDLNITISDVRGDVRGSHVKAVWDFLENNFIDHTSSITPNELFWLFASLQSKVAFGNNKKKEWYDFLESKYPTQSFMESSISVTLKDIEIMVAKPEEATPFPYLELRTPEFNFSCLKEEAAMEVNINVTPIVGRIIESTYDAFCGGASSTTSVETLKGQLNPGEDRHKSFFCIGGLVFSFIKHCGPRPFRPKVQQLLKLQIDGIVFDMNSANVLRLAQILLALKNEVFCEDKALEDFIYRARVEAEQNLNTNMPNVPEGETETDDVLFYSSPSHTSAIYGETDYSLSQGKKEGLNHHSDDNTQNFPRDASSKIDRDESSAQKEHTIPIAPNILSWSVETVPSSLAEKFVEYLAEQENNEAMFKEYGLEFIDISLPTLSGAIRFSSTDLFWIQAPEGITVQSSSLNTLFATKQLSLQVPEITIKGMRPASIICDASVLSSSLKKLRDLKASSQLNSGISAPNNDDLPYSRKDGEDEEAHLVEVFHCHTGIILSHKTESSIDGGLKQHLLKQREFIGNSNYRKMMHEQVVNPISSSGICDNTIQRTPVVRVKTDTEEKVLDSNHQKPSAANSVDFPYSHLPLESKEILCHNLDKREDENEDERDKKLQDVDSQKLCDMYVGERKQLYNTACSPRVIVDPVAVNSERKNEVDRRRKERTRATVSDQIVKDSQMSITGTTEIQSSRHFFSCVSCSSLDSDLLHSLHDEDEEFIPATKEKDESVQERKENSKSLSFEKPEVQESRPDVPQRVFVCSHLATPVSASEVKVPSSLSSSGSNSSNEENSGNDDSFHTEAEGEGCPPWRYYSFYRQPKNSTSTTSLDYNPNILTATHYHDRCAFCAPLPLLLFDCVLPSIRLDEPYVPISQQTDEFESVAGGESLIFGKRNSGVFETSKGIPSNESFMIEHWKISGGQHIIREHIMIECERTSVIVAAEVCPLLGNFVDFGNSCLSIVEERVGTTESEKRINTIFERSDTLPIKKGMRSTRVFYKTRKPVVLYIVHAKVPKFTFDVVGKRRNEEIRNCNAVSQDERHLLDEGLLRMSLTAHDIIFSLQQRPDTHVRNGYSSSKSNGQTLTIILRYGSLIAVSSIEGDFSDRGSVEIDIPCFYRQLTPRCIAGVAYAGKGNAMMCIHTFPFHVILSPISLGAIGIHLTKDFSDTLFMLKIIVDEIKSSCTGESNPEMKSKSWLPSAAEDDNDTSSHNESGEGGRSSRSSSSSPVRHDVISFDHGRTQIEGKILLEKISFVLYDITRQSLVSDEASQFNQKGKKKRLKWIMNPDLNSFNVGTSHFNFSLKMERNYTFTKTLLHGTGNIGNISVILFPNVVLVLRSFLPLVESPNHAPMAKEHIVQASEEPINENRHVESVELNLSCRFNNFEADIMETEKNHLRLHVRDVALSHSTHSEEFRLAPDLDVNQFSLFVKTRLCFLAIRSKLHFLNGSRTAMCSLSVRSQLKSTTSVALSDLSASYVPDMKWEENSIQNCFTPSNGDVSQEVVKIGVQFMNLAVHSCFVPEVMNEQFNISMYLSELFVHLPYIPHFSDVIYPQLQHFVFSWRSAFFKSSCPSHRNVPKSNYKVDYLSSVYPWAQNINFAANSNVFRPAAVGKAIWLILKLGRIHVRVGLDDEDTQEFLFPSVYSFLQGSDERWNLKTHVHSFFAFSGNNKRKDYEVYLPDVFIHFSGDEKKLAVLSVIGKISANITTLLLHHSTLALQKVLEEIVPLFKPIPLEDKQTSEISSSERKMINFNLIRKVKYRRQSIAVLFCGGKLSYLTQLSTLRFSINCFRACGKSEPENRRNEMKWSASIDHLQMALTDRRNFHHHKRTNHNFNTSAGFAPSPHDHSPNPSAGKLSAFKESRAYSQSMCKSVESIAPEEAEIMGFVWGSLNLSLSLSNEMVNEQKGLDAFVNTSFAAHTSDIRNYILKKVGESVNRWNFNVNSPVAILRFGFNEVLLQTLREIKENLDALSKASAKNKLRSLSKLQQIEKFKTLQAQKNTIYHLIEEADKEHRQSIENAERQVAQELSSRVLLMLKSRDLKDFWLNVRSFSKHICSGTINQISIIIPVGDAAYRRVVEEIFSPTKHVEIGEIGEMFAPDTKVFQPHFAIKLQIQKVCLLFSLTKTDTSFQSMIQEATKGMESAQNIGNKSLAIEVSPSIAVNGRIALNDLRIFMTDGTSLEVAPPIVYESALSEPVLVGGKGILSLLRHEEFRLSRNFIHIRSIGMPFNFRKLDVMNCRTVLDISSPQVHCSPWIFPLIADILQEFPEANHSKLFSRTQQKIAQFTNGKGSPKAHFSSVPNLSSENSFIKKGKGVEIERIPLQVDVSARLDKGNILFFSHTYGEEVSQAAQLPRASKFDRVRAETNHNGKGKLNEHAESLPQRLAFTSLDYSIDHNSEQMVSLPPIPIPSAVLQISVRSDNKDDNRVVRAEVNMGEICLSPNMLMIAEEIQSCLDKFDWIKKQRTNNLLKALEELSIDESMKRTLRFCKCSIIEVYLPTPYVYTRALRAKQYYPSILEETDNVDQSSDSSEKSYGFIQSNTVVHCSIQHFRVVLDTSPVHSTSFSCYLSDQGSIDILLQFRKNIDSHTALVPPDSSVIFHVHELRAECQTRLEVKSLEVYCPELTFLLGQRKKADKKILTVSLNLPFNIDTSEQNLLVRFQHLSQVFILMNIWEKSVTDFSVAVSQSLFSKIEPSNFSVKESGQSRPIPLNVSKMANRTALQKNFDKYFAVSISGGWFEVDLGGGNVHRLSSGTLKLCAQLSATNGGLTQFKTCRLSLRDVIIKSDGLLSGSARINEALLLMYIIANDGHSDKFLRTKEGRTFRFFSQAKCITCSYKERHVKDVLELKCDFLKVTAADGINDDGYAFLDVDVDIGGAKLRINPSTMPAFLNLVYSLSVTLHTRREAAIEKIKYVAQSKQLPPYILQHITAIKPIFGEGNANTFSTSEIELGAFVPFMGSQLEKIPCGQLQLSISHITFVLGAASAEDSNFGTVVAHAPFVRICFAECTTANYKITKRILQITSENVEIFRPLPSKSLIIGLKGTNILEFYTNQRIGEREVGFTLDLSQDHPWTGNPIYRDFAEIVQLINQFIDNSNIQILKKLMNGDVHSQFNDDLEGFVTSSRNADEQPPASQFSRSSSIVTDQIAAKAELKRELDPRIFKPLRPAKFSPQLRFGGDISVNTEVILNWFGVTEKVLPRAIHCAIGDKFEEILEQLMKRVVQSESITPSNY